MLAYNDLRQFTAKTGTIFENSPLGLDKWLVDLTKSSDSELR